MRHQIGQCIGWILGFGALVSPSTVVAQTVRVAMEEADNRPFEWRDERTGQLQGLHVQVVRAVAQKLGWSVEFVRLPWKRALQSLEHGEVHAVTYMAKNAEREQTAYFLPDNILHVARSYVYVAAGNPRKIPANLPLAQLAQQYAVGASSGYYYGATVAQAVADGAPIDMPTVTQTTLFQMLVRGRYDAVVGNALGFLASQRDDPAAAVQPLTSQSISCVPLYIAFAKGGSTERLAQDFAVAYRALRQTPAYRTLLGQTGTQAFAATGDPCR